MKTIVGISSLALIFAIAGCGKSDTVTVDTPDGKATVTTDRAGTTEGTVEGEGGKLETKTDASGNFSATSTDEKGNVSTMKMGTKVDTKEIGIDLYPGATMPEGTPADSTIETPDGVTYTIVRTTPDDPTKVAEFYKKLIKSASSVTSGDNATIGGKTESGAEVVISAVKDKEKGHTIVSLMVQRKKK